MAHDNAPMGTLYLVRHGQASFGAADYDQLSELGRRQCVRLGEHLRLRGVRVDHVMTGALRRHAQSLDGIAEGLQLQAEPSVWPQLNEYDSEALVRAIHPEPLPEADPATAFREHFRLLRQALTAWMDGRTQPQGVPTHAHFADGVRQALDHVREEDRGTVLLVSSGGPIATAVGHVLGLAPGAVIDLNMRIRNSALTEFHVTPKRHLLVGFNSIAHLEHPDHAGWVTYA